jgi:probable DNA metabolism protein
MKKTIKLTAKEPLIALADGIVYAQRPDFCDITTRDLRVSLIRPRAFFDYDKRVVWPVVVFICGGAWTEMDRNAWIPELAWFAKKGYVIASVDYSVTARTRFPQQIVDIKEAIRFLRAHADKLGIDPNRFAVMGESAGGYLAALTGAAGELFEVSVNAFDAFVHAWMSELPLETEIIRFGFKVIRAARRAVSAGAAGAWKTLDGARRAAEKAAVDRGDGDVFSVLEAAYKVSHEIDRLRGLLRFRADGGGVYTARCAPDHYVLPALAGYFTLRFGETPWTIIDEKRRLALVRQAGEAPQILALSPSSLISRLSFPACDTWEDLWRTYFNSVNNQERKNPSLQRQFMPVRYWKYLPELRDTGGGGV